MEDAVQIDIGRLKDRPNVWVVLDDHSLVYAEFATQAEATKYASQEAFKLRVEGWEVCIKGGNGGQP